VRLTEGEILLDQSMLTGESVPIEAGAGFETYAGALVRRGEALKNRACLPMGSSPGQAAGEAVEKDVYLR